MTKILIVEDQKDMVEGLVFNLEAQGYETCVAYDGEEGLSTAVKENPDLIILDVMLPKKDGFQVCRDLREKGFDMPILMLTARSEEADKVLGFDVGADDYLTKPFGILELSARVKALLKRHKKEPPEIEEFRFGKCILDFKNHKATKGGETVDLTPREFAMMLLFIKNKGNVVSRDQFLDEIWGYDKFPTTRTVDIHIARLRQKLEKNPDSPQFILTVHGYGYKFIG
jgi:two-component system alkaline phosphatase synthesis response regulator PhoP